MEEWRDVSGEFRGVYQVSSLGRVQRVMTSRNWVRGYVLKPKVDVYGYSHVRLQHEGRQQPTTIHKLVATAFLGPPLEGQQINHKNGDKTDNRASNLEWVTHEQNVRHFHRRLGSWKRSTGPRLNHEKAVRIRALYKTGEYTYKELAKKYDVTWWTIGRIIRGETYGPV